MGGSNGASWVIGVDEAGYGPNLGPLAVAATAWRAPAGVDLATALADAVTADPLPGDARLHVADSKAVYKPGGGLAALERAVHAACDQPRSWDGIVERLGADPDGRRHELAWHDGFDPALPIDAPTDDLAAAGDLLRATLERSGVRPPCVAARLVFPAEFNALVDEHGTKGAALSFVSIGLARRLVDGVGGAEPIAVTFDKHGGRNRYGALLQEHFPDGWVETLDESRPVSRYRLGDRLSFSFRTKGEAELPVAWASMTAKLLREIAMRALNAYWAAHVPGLRPTAGYPVDAKRFKADIAAKQAELGVDDHLLWRNR